MTWYRKISQDIGLIPDCITHFEQELEKAKQEVKIYGSLEKASASRPVRLAD